jgi:hypothetical protein
MHFGAGSHTRRLQERVSLTKSSRSQSWRGLVNADAAKEFLGLDRKVRCRHRMFGGFLKDADVVRQVVRMA